MGLITSQQRNYLNEIYDVNVLLFELLLKLSLRHPETNNRLSPGIFTRNLFKDLIHPGR